MIWRGLAETPQWGDWKALKACPALQEYIQNRSQEARTLGCEDEVMMSSTPIFVSLTDVGCKGLSLLWPFFEDMVTLFLFPLADVLLHV